MDKNRDLGRWTGGTRSVADHLSEYDWDGQIAPACAEIEPEAEARMKAEIRISLRM